MTSLRDDLQTFYFIFDTFTLLESYFILFCFAAQHTPHTFRSSFADCANW